MRQPMVSVIIPTYNRDGSLQRAIRSVLCQTFSDLEVLVIDDASTVNVEGIVGGFSDKRIGYVRHSHNKGVAAAKNTGIRMATGQYIAFLDDDDVYVERKIERQLEIFEESPPSVGLVYCSAAYVTEDNRFLRKKDTGNRSSDVSYHIDNIGPTPLIRKVCFDEIGLFDESFRCFEDWDMWLRISRRFDFKATSEPLYVDIRHSSSQISDNLLVIMKFLEKLFRKHANTLEHLPRNTKRRMYSKFHKTRAVTLYDSGMIREGKLEAIRAFFLDPLSTRIWRLILVGFMGSRVWRLSRALGNSPR